MREPRIWHINAQPTAGFQAALRKYLEESPDAILILAYDSGFVPNEAIPYIRAADEREISVFGARGTLFEDYIINLTIGSEGLNRLYEMQPDVLEAGLVPLQGFPPPILDIADNAKEMADNSKFLIDATMTLRSVDTARYIVGGLKDICSKFRSYKDRIREARKRFNSDAFNERIDRTLEGIIP